MISERPDFTFAFREQLYDSSRLAVICIESCDKSIGITICLASLEHKFDVVSQRFYVIACNPIGYLVLEVLCQRRWIVLKVLIGDYYCLTVARLERIDATIT